MDSESSLRTLSLVHYYLREGYYGTALQYCETRGKEEAELQVAVLKGVALILLGKSAEALRVLESLRNGQCELGVLYGLKAAHSLAANPDKTSLAELDAAITTATKEAPEVGFVSAAEVLFFTGQASKAKSVLEKLVKAQESYDASRKNAKMHCLMGWIELTLGKDQRTTKEMFELASSQGYPDGFIGRGRLFESHHSPGEMKAVAKELMTANVSFLPGHIERCRASLASREWDGVLQALQNSNLASESDNAMISFLSVVHTICAGGSSIETSLNELKTSLDTTEKDNHPLLHKIAALLIRCSARSKIVLMFARNLLVRAIQMSRRVEYQVEELRLAMAMEDAKETSAIARELIQHGSEHPFALLGMSIGFLMSGKINEAAEQLEFVQNTHPNIISSSVFYFVGALISRHKNKSYEEFLRKISDALSVHKAAMQNIPFGLDNLFALDVDLLYSMALQVLDYAPIAPVKGPNEALKTAESVLALIIDACPGISQATFAQARVFYLKSDPDSAEQMIELCLKKNETIADAYLLRAQIRVDKGQVQDADNCLNTGLNFNFAVRDSALFHLIKAKVFKRRGEMDRAVDLLKSGLKLPVAEKKDNQNLMVKKEANEAHRIAMQIELIDCYQTLKRTHDAESSMESALEEWKGRPEGEQLVLLHAQLHVNKGDPDTALAILAKIEPTQNNYQAARIKMAEIYLEEKKDKRMFTVCYKELMNTTQTPTTLTLLGDAYLSVQEPEKAIEVYERALKLSSTRDIALTEKIGEAYVMCHLYTKAVNFYESAMNSSKDKRMRIKLADLLLKLGNIEKCERVLKQPLSEDTCPIEPATIAAHVQYHQLLSKLHLEAQKLAEAFDDLNSAKQLQMKLIQKNDSAGSIAAKKEVARINCSMGELKQRQRQYKEAIELYNDAHSFDPTNVKIILMIAGVHMALGRNAKCGESCRQALLIDKHNDDATLMMADLLYLQNDMEQAMVHFANLLDKYPIQISTTLWLVSSSFRGGMATSSRRTNSLRRALDHNPRAAVDSGYNYCKGLHEWYSGEPNAALHAFSRAKKDAEWGDRSICNVIEICLNPDNEVLGGEVLYQDDGDDADRLVGTKAAERYLDELRYKSQGMESRYALMENFILVASGDRAKVQNALQNLLSMVGPEPQPVASVGAVLGCARAYMLQKQVPKAKAILKRVIAHPWTLEDADYLEKCWLLLADLYITQSKPDQATAVLRTVLQRNRSCIKAYEFLGFLREKESKFNEAAMEYDQAFKLSQFKSPSIGYKLAFNYLKCKRLFECLEVCHRVLHQTPTYPKIRRDVLEKARAQLRS